MNFAFLFSAIILVIIFTVISMFLISSLHEMGHYIFARALDIKPFGIALFRYVFPAAVFRNEGNEEEEKIIAIGGPIFSLISIMLLAFLVPVFFFGFQVFTVWEFWLLALVGIIFQSLNDLGCIFLEDESGSRWVKNIKNFIESFTEFHGKSCNVVLVLSEESWERRKEWYYEEFLSSNAREISLKSIWIKIKTRSL